MVQTPERPNESENNAVDVKALLEELRATVEHARSMPMSSSAVINRAEVLAQIEADRGGAARGVRRVRPGVSPSASDVLADARSRPSGSSSRPANERDRLVSDSEVYRVAKHEVGQLKEQVARECEALRQETDEYVDGRLANLEITLTKTLEAVTRGRDRLQRLVRALENLSADDEARSVRNSPV